ncbi:MAG: ATP-binding protein [Pseudomonadota bacterium]
MASTTPPKGKMKYRSQLIIAFCLLIILPLVLLGLLGYQGVVGHLRRDGAARLTEIRDRKAALIDSWIEDEMYHTHLAADGVTLKDYLRHPSQVKAEVARRRLMSFAANDGDRAFLVSAGGHIVLSSRLADEGRPAGPRLAEVLDGRLGKVFPSDARQTLVQTAAPVVAVPGQRPLGAVVLETDLSKDLACSLLHPAGLGKTGELRLVNRNLAILNESRSRPGEALGRRASSRAATLAAQGKTGLTQCMDCRGVPVMAAYTGIPKLGWGLVIKQDLAELEAPIERVFRLFLAVGGATLLLAACAAALLARRITRPLEALADAARRRARGEEAARVEERGPAEVVVTAVAFNSMVEARNQAERKLDLARERVEQLARGEEERANWLAAIIDQLPIGVFIAGAPDGRFLLTNKAIEEQWGRPAPEGVSLGNTKELFHYRRPDGSHYPEEKTPLYRAIRHGEVIHEDEMLVERADGSTIHLKINAAPIRAGDKIVGAVLAQWDVSAEREVQRKLEEANRMKDEFLSLASHELKTPITSIKLFSELAVRTPEKLDSRIFGILLRQADQLCALINDLLDVSRLQLGKMPMEMRPLDLAGLVGDLCERRRPMCPAGRALSCPRVDGELLVIGDPVRLEQLVSNLLDNALKYTPEGRDIQVRVARHGDKALIKVQDEGIGIGPEHLPHVFERFYKPGPQQAVYTGLGVGLYICKQIAERHGGRITVESEPGKGSTFRVELPLAPLAGWQGHRPKNPGAREP